MNAVRLFPLEATTAAKDYLKGGWGGGGISPKFQPSRSKSKSRKTFLPRI